LHRTGQARRRAQRGATPPSSASQTFDTTPGRVTVSRGARRGRGQPLGWRRKAPDPEEPAAWRSYLPRRGPALPGSVGSPCFRPLPTEGVPSFRRGALKPAHAGAPAAPPMLSPLGPSQEPSPLEAAPPAVARTPVPPAPADWRAARRDRAPPGG
jgi:hypothetical protein